MKIKNLVATLRGNWSWVLTVYLICVLYLLVDLSLFQLSPYSGRISTLVCKRDRQDQVVCTATIHGWLGRYQRDFLADEFSKVVLTEESPGGFTASHVCGIMIEAKSRYVKLVDPWQPCSKMVSFADKLRQALGNEIRSSLRVAYIGWNFWTYFRIALLFVFGFLISIKWGLPSRPPQKTYGRKGKRIFSSWLKINLAVKTIFYFTYIFLSGTWLILFVSYPYKHGAFMSICPWPFTLSRVCGSCASFPIPQIIGVYPLLTVTALVSFYQWRRLRQEFPISRWWLGAPVLASLVFIAGINAATTCYDYLTLHFLSSGLTLDITPKFIWLIIFYALLLGAIQWLALRKYLSKAGGWIIIPLINILIGPLIYYFLDKYQLWDYYLAKLIVCVLLTEILQAGYLSWMVRKNIRQQYAPPSSTCH
jgi:hypothetical protein